MPETDREEQSRLEIWQSSQLSNLRSLISRHQYHSRNTFGLLLFSFVLLLTSCQPSTNSPLPATPTAIPESWMVLENQDTQLVFIERVPIPLENCNGSTAVGVNINRERSTTTTIDVSATGSAEVGPEVIKAKIEASLSVKEGTTNSFSHNVQVGVEPGTQVTYELIWNETWQVGEVVIDNLGLRVPYKVRTGLASDLKSGEAQSCVTETPIAAPTHTPTNALTLSPTTTFTQISLPTLTEIPVKKQTAMFTLSPSNAFTSAPTAMLTNTLPQFLTFTPMPTVFSKTISVNVALGENRETAYNIEQDQLALSGIPSDIVFRDCYVPLGSGGVICKLDAQQVWHLGNTPLINASHTEWKAGCGEVYGERCYLNVGETYALTTFSGNVVIFKVAQVVNVQGSSTSIDLFLQWIYHQTDNTP